MANTNTHAVSLASASSQYLSIADASQTGLDLSGDFTIECWFKRSTDTTQVLVAKSDYDANPSRGYSLEIDVTTTTSLDVEISDGSSRVRKGISYNFLTGTWYHVAVVYTASAGSVEYYVDGKSRGTQTAFPTSIVNNAFPLEIGAGYGHTTNPQLNFNGSIDDVRIWNDVRTVTEIQANMDSELVGNEANLQGYWKLNNALTDSTANANTLTNNNSATFSTSYAFGTENTNTANLASASSQYFSLTSSASLRQKGDFTIEGWFYFTTLPSSGSHFWLVDKKSESGEDFSVYALRLTNTSGTYTLVLRTTNGSSASLIDKSVTWSTPTTGVWYHIAVARTSSGGGIDFYVNGTQVGTTQTGYNGTLHDNSDLGFYVGRYKSADGRYFNGAIDDLRIWSSVRSQPNISTNMSLELTGTESGLVGYWKFNNNPVDETANGNHLINNNSVTYGTNLPFPISTFTPKAVFIN